MSTIIFNQLNNIKNKLQNLVKKHKQLEIENQNLKLEIDNLKNIITGLHVKMQDLENKNISNQIFDKKLEPKNKEMLTEKINFYIKMIDNLIISIQKK